MWDKSSFLPGFLSVLLLLLAAGFSPSSNQTVDRACGEGIVTTQVGNDECSKTVTYYGVRAFGLCTGTDTKCKEVTISGPCDVIAE